MLRVNPMKVLKNYFILVFNFLLLSWVAKFVFAQVEFDDVGFYQQCYAIFYGYKFDLAISGSLAFLICLADFNRKALIYLSLSSTFILSAILFGDIIYFQESARHVSYEIKDLFSESVGLIGTAFASHLDVVLMSIAITFIWLVVANKVFQRTLSALPCNKFYPLQKLVLIVLTIFCIRGLFQNIPLNPYQAYKIGESRLAMLSLNSAYNLAFNLIDRRGNIQATKPYQVANEKQHLREIFAEKASVKPSLPVLNKPNIVIFFLESWGAALLKDYGGEHDVAPRFHQLLQKSLRPKGMLAGGHRTAEGIFTTLSSWQNPLGQAVAGTKLQDFQYPSLIELLKQAHYSTAFFQGSNPNNRAGDIALKLGFTASYGRHDIKKRQYEENHWGVHDPDLYQFVLEKVAQMQKPFVIGINGTTTHDTTLPKGYPMKNYTTDEAENGFLNALHFSDMATGDFIAQMEKRYPNTIFVIMADHTANLKTQSNFLQYLIPLAIYSTKLKASYIDEFVSQRDVAPTLVDLALGDYHQLAPNFTGKSLIQERNFLADYYHNGTLGLAYKDEALEFIADQLHCFDLKDYHPKPKTCENKQQIEKLKALTNFQQRQLFEGKTREFNRLNKFAFK